MKEKDDTLAQGCFVSALLFLPMMAFNAWVICKLWLWLAVPITGLRPIGMIQALALATVFGFMTADVSAFQYERKRIPMLTSVLTSVSTRLFIGFLSLGIGAIWARFI